MTSNNWKKIFKTGCIKRPGQHISIPGTTGMGKSNALQFCIDGIARFSKDTIVIFDSGKSSELLIFSKFKPLHLIIPAGLDVRIALNEGVNLDIKKSYFKKPEEIWDLLIQSRINIVCLEAFVLEPEAFTQIIINIFKNLIKRAVRQNIMTPLTVAIEEINRIAPGKGYAHSIEHNRLGAVFEHNIEYIRSMGIRMIGTHQGFKSVRLGVRQHFHWIIAKNGCRFSEGRLARYNFIFEGLAESQGIIIYPDSKYSDVINFDYYGEGRDIGNVTYIGEIVITLPNDYDSDAADAEPLILLDDLLGIKKPSDAADVIPEISPKVSDAFNLLNDNTKRLIYDEACAAGFGDCEGLDMDLVILKYIQAKNYYSAAAAKGGAGNEQQTAK